MNKKKVFVIISVLSAALIFIVFLSNYFSHLLNSSNSYSPLNNLSNKADSDKTMTSLANKPQLSYTNFESPTNQSSNISSQTKSVNKNSLLISYPQLGKTLPFENEDIKIELLTTGKILVTKKTPLAETQLDRWLINNQLFDQKNNSNLIVYATSLPNSINYQTENELPINNINSAVPTIAITPIENNRIIIDLLKILLNLTSNTSEDSTNPVSVPTELLRQITSLTPSVILSKPINLSPTSANKSTKTPKTQTKYVYYKQCGGSYDQYPLPLGCTICQAGCGPTTVAMIIASYKDKSVNPKTVVDLYKSRGFYLGCAGSRYSDAKSALGAFGLKTTDYLIYSYATINQAGADFRRYIAAGWTIFVLANFCDGGCGHFFWIVEVSSNNDTWAYDPYYGRLQSPPYNEKARYPFPKYRVAFGVKP